MIIDVFIGTKKLELFKDETVELNSSIANTSDITKNTTEYTKSFTVPASDINNEIFKHYYNANVDNTFDARVKVAGRIELGGVPFKYGKWRLEKVSVAKGMPKDYTINFRGNLVSLKDKFKEDTLNDLDLSYFDHVYNDTNVKTGLTGSLFSGDLVYNLFSNKQYYYNGIVSDNINTDVLANIAWAGGTLTGVRWNELKPSLRLSKVVEAIATKYGLTFSNDFFGRDEFTKLFIWLNNEVEIKGIKERVDFTSGDTTFVNLTTDVGTYTNVYINPTNRITFTHQLIVTPTAGFEDVNYTVTTYINGVSYSQNSFTGVDNIVFSSPIISGNYTVYFEIESEQPFTYTCRFLQQRFTYFLGGGVATQVNFNTYGGDTLVSNFNASSNLPNLKVLDFIKGLFQMFKLVVIADSEDNVYINTMKDYYAQGIVYDLTRYIDFEKYDVERGTILNTINFGFEEPTTLLNETFKKNTGLGYGDEELILEDEDGNLLDGDQLDVKVPFEQIIYERLIDLNDKIKTNVMYAGVFDANIEAVNPKAHVYYNINQNISSKPIAFRNSSNVKEIINFINIPSHTIDFNNPQYSTIFSEEFNEWDGINITNTLYYNYYKDYIESIFNIKRRTFKYTAKNIPIRILTKLELKDIVRIKEDFYRIDNYNFNLLTGETSFNLINSFDNTVLPFNADRRVIFADHTEQTQSVYVTNLNSFDFISSETWVSCTNSGSNVYFNIDENLTGLERTATVTIIDTDTLREVEVIVIQSAGIVTFDNEEITFDNNITTWDNG